MPDVILLLQVLLGRYCNDKVSNSSNGTFVRCHVLFQTTRAGRVPEMEQCIPLSPHNRHAFMHARKVNLCHSASASWGRLNQRFLIALTARLTSVLCLGHVNPKSNFISVWLVSLVWLHILMVAIPWLTRISKIAQWIKWMWLGLTERSQYARFSDSRLLSSSLAYWDFASPPYAFLQLFKLSKSMPFIHSYDYMTSTILA